MFRYLILPILFATVIFTPDTAPLAPGNYPIEVYYQTDEEGVSSQITMTVGSENYVTKDNIAIDGNDITTITTQSLTNDFLINASEVRAWNTETAESYQITDVGIKQIDDTNYNVTFTTILDVSTTVNLQLLTQGEVNAKYIELNQGQFLHIYIVKGYLKFTVLSIVILLLVSLILMLIIFHINSRMVLKKINKLY